MFCSVSLLVEPVVVVYVCEAPGDDILIFVYFRLEATVSQSPVVKGKNKRHAQTCAFTHTPLYSHTLQKSLHTTMSTTSSTCFLLRESY